MKMIKEDIYKDGRLPHVTVSAVCERDGKFLIIEENVDGRKLYTHPGGHVEKGELLLDAVVRETLEESGYHFSPEFIIGVYQYTDPRIDVSYVRVSFYGTCEQGTSTEDVPLDAKTQQVLWMTREELTAIEKKLRSPLVLQSIDDYLASCHYPLRLIRKI